MLDVKAVAALPDTIRIPRLATVMVANRKMAGTINVTDQRLKISDPAFVKQFDALPARIPNGTHNIHVYLWEDAHQGAINTCAVIQFSRPRLLTVSDLVFRNTVRPEMDEGFIVDSGTAAFTAETSVTIDSGFGDGYYPVYATWNFGLWLQAIVIDFEVWKVRRYALLPWQALDAFGFPYDTRKPGSNTP